MMDDGTERIRWLYHVDYDFKMNFLSIEIDPGVEIPYDRLEKLITENLDEECYAEYRDAFMS